MKKHFYIALLSLSTLASACTPVTAQRGNMLEDVQLQEVTVGQSSISDVLRTLGSPTPRTTPARRQCDLVLELCGTSGETRFPLWRNGATSRARYLRSSPTGQGLALLLDHARWQLRQLGLACGPNGSVGRKVTLAISGFTTALHSSDNSACFADTTWPSF